MHEIPIGTFVYHELCEGRYGIPSAVVRETRDLNKMIFCFNCKMKIFVNGSYWPEPILYEEDEKMTVIKHMEETEETKLPDLLSIPQKWLIIDAPTGAGKTTSIEKLVRAQPDKSVLVIAKFTTLVRNLAERYLK